MTAPYVVDVIGDPDNLADALAFSDGPRDNVERSAGHDDRRGALVARHRGGTPPGGS